MKAWFLFGALALAGLAVERGEPDVQLMVNNPYRWPVEVELKCDWQPKSGAFRLVRRLVLAPRRATALSVPFGLRNCQIWPHVRF